MADPKAFFELLFNHGVDYVIIDKIAAALHGVPVVAESIAIFPRCERDNDERLANALNECDARLQLEHGELDSPVSADVLESGWRQLPMGLGHRFSTTHGNVDIVYLPDGLEKGDDTTT